MAIRTTKRGLDIKQKRLAALPALAKARPSSIRRLASVVEEVRAAAGRVILESGRHYHHVYFIESGIVTVEIGDHEATQLEAGQFIGAIDFFAGGPATATVKATTDVELMVIPHRAFELVLGESPGLLRIVTEQLAGHLAEAYVERHSMLGRLVRDDEHSQSSAAEGRSAFSARKGGGSSLATST